ncbi:MAG TPA: DUF308 domain-containing protein [Solirubrobacteraceae bacterium]|nr:DUF308 domain-containing protein [Solirubrobacteraceae bacterium]
MFTFTASLSRGQAALRGLAAAIVGFVFIVWPGISIGTAAVLFAVYCIIDAAVQFSNVFDGDESGAQTGLRVLLAVLDIAAAAIAIIWPGPTAGVLVIVIGLWAIFGGFAELWGAFAVGSGWLGLTGVLSIAAGVVLVAWPGIGAVSLAIIVGAYLAAYGIILLIEAATTPAGESVGDPVAGP